MSRKLNRDSNGQFAAGQSGNPDGGRRRKPRALLTLDDIHTIQLSVASEVIGTRKNGKDVTRYESLSIALANGKAANRLAARDFMELTRSSASYFEIQKRRAKLTGGRS